MNIITRYNNRGGSVVSVEGTHDVELAKKVAWLELGIVFPQQQYAPRRVTRSNGTRVVRFSRSTPEPSHAATGDDNA